MSESLILRLIMVPRLTTALTGPLLNLEQRILGAQSVIEHWFRTQWQKHTIPFYTSVDLRNSGFKLGSLIPNPYSSTSLQLME